MPPSRTGSLIWRKSGWSARVRMLVDGEMVRRMVPLGTNDQQAARLKLRKLLAKLDGDQNLGDVVATSGGPETYADVSERVWARREAEGVKDVYNERGRNAKHVLPYIGDMIVTQIRVHNINAIYQRAREGGASASSIKHIRHVMRTVFDDLWRDELIPENPVKRARLPRGKVDLRERTTLEDAELEAYLRYSHPKCFPTKCRRLTSRI